MKQKSKFKPTENKKFSESSSKMKETEIGKNDFIGIWHITKMSEWDEEYCNMEVQAYVRIEKNGMGEFQFGLVSGSICGDFKKEKEHIIYDFIWDGNDECDTANGDGRMKINSDRTAEGEIRIHLGDSSKFWAKKHTK